jgi:uncharacterized membrane protein YdbT with pleckstrin-like domain
MFEEELSPLAIVVLGVIATAVIFLVPSLVDWAIPIGCVILSLLAWAGRLYVRRASVLSEKYV